MNSTCRTPSTLLSGFVLALLVAGCGAAPATAPGSEGSASTAGSSDSDASACDPAAEVSRINDTVSRTSGCAAAVVTVGTAQVARAIATSLNTMDNVVAAVNAVQTAVAVTDTASAEAYLCAQAFSTQVTKDVARQALTDLIAAGQGDLSATDIDTIAAQWDQLSQNFLYIAALGNAYTAYVQAGDAASLQAFAVALAKSGGAFVSFLGGCGPLLGATLPDLTQLGSDLSSAATLGSVATCAVAAVQNASDVVTELQCLADDYEAIDQQEASLVSGNAAICATLGTEVSNPILRPLLRDTQDSSDTRVEACYHVISDWGSCLYGATTSGTFGARSLTCDECAQLCTGFINGAGTYGYLQPVLDQAISTSNTADPQTLQGIVSDAATSCVTNVLQADGLKPCMDMCIGGNGGC